MLSAVYAVVVCLCVCHTPYYIKTTERRITQMQVGGLKLATFDEKCAITRKRYKIDAYCSFY